MIRFGTLVSVGVLLLVTHGAAQRPAAQPAPVTFGGAYSALDARRQQLVNGWVTRFAQTTGQRLEAEPFYDEVLSLSSKTTFEAVTHALMTSQLTDQSGASLGDALALVDRVEALRGQVAGASGDRQFRMYVRLAPGAVDALSKSQQFKRGVDNSVFHKGYPVNFREQGGVPSIQISVALNRSSADIDVDYRSSSFPLSLFNGHLSAANSDVRAGDNFNRHSNRWGGLQNWWHSFFGVRAGEASEDPTPSNSLVPPRVPRAGNKTIDVMVHDFLTAWLVEGDVMAAMGYVSERSGACVAEDSNNPSGFDRGMAPFQIMMNLKAAHDALGPRSSLEGVTIGTRLTRPGLKVVTQRYHAQFVIYSVPDDVAAAFDCQSRSTLAARKPQRVYGNYFGTTFYIGGSKDTTVALLWAKDDAYWKIVSWQVGGDDGDAPTPAAPDVKVVRIKADDSLVQSARGFLETWLIRKDYAAAFGYLSDKSYACYDVLRSPDQPASTSPADAGQRTRANLEAVGNAVDRPPSLDAVIAAAEPFHPAIRVMDHRDAGTFSLAAIPNALGDAAECAARARGEQLPDPLPLEYGNAFELTVRFRTRSGDTPVLRMMWRREAGDWRITSYDVVTP